MNDIFKIKDNTLFIDNVSTVALAKEYGTPLYVYSETEIRRRIDEIKTMFTEKYKRAKAAYASKAFLTVAMAQLINREGLLLDVVSGGELYTAIAAGFPAARIEFHGNNKSYEELDRAIGYGVGKIIIDAFGELEMIENLAEKYSRNVNVLFRITPAVEVDTHSFISTGHADSKFGFSMDARDEGNLNGIYSLFQKAIESKFVTLSGIHFHIGSQLFTNKSHLDALAVALGVYREVNDRFGYALPEINIGGGFGANYTEADDRKPYSYFLDPVMEEVQRFCAQYDLKEPTIVIEPGRSIVGEAGITLYTVGSIRTSGGGTKYVSIDGGMPDNIRPALYGAKYEAILANKADEPVSETVTICGKCCETGDKIIEDGTLARAERGDILAVFTTGAYGYSMASNYNRLPVPAVLFVADGKVKEIVKRQTFEDLIRNDLTI
ncbi:MAG: diaminopimelate decarboxylase [Clostridiales Family XIII bacterium]|jgi:diaminopimelate decarboxylase|nr:diaminopimelate decarboxylase [Clostridiales Family XIII bacterium]